MCEVRHCLNHTGSIYSLIDCDIGYSDSGDDNADSDDQGFDLTMTPPSMASLSSKVPLPALADFVQSPDAASMY
jgi:hypothetical protein